MGEIRIIKPDGTVIVIKDQKVNPVVVDNSGECVKKCEHLILSTLEYKKCIRDCMEKQKEIDSTNENDLEINENSNKNEFPLTTEGEDDDSESQESESESSS